MAIACRRWWVSSEPGSGHAITRTRRPTSRPSPICRRHHWLGGSDAIIDGEMVALDADGRPDFSLLQELVGMKGLGVKRRERPPDSATEPRPGSLVYHAFDLLHLDGWSLLDVPLLERKRLLRLHTAGTRIGALRQPCAGARRGLPAAVTAQGLEGSMAKRQRSRYTPGMRSRDVAQGQGSTRAGAGGRRLRTRSRQPPELGSLLVATREVERLALRRPRR